jgi:cytochrome c oxidase subunit II
MTNSFDYLIKHKLLNLPTLASEHGRHVDDLIVYVHALMAVLFVGWFAYFLYALVRFRRSRNPKADYVGVKGHFSNWIEGGVALIEAILLLGFAVPLWAKVVTRPPSEKDATVINVIGRQFNWNGHYAGVDGKIGQPSPARSTGSDPFGLDRKGDANAKDDVVVQGNFVVPVNKDVLLNITSLDVIHSFAVRSMRVCQDAVPGLRISTWFKPVKEGDYKVTCAQLCGNSHYGMFATLKVVSQADYDKWLGEQSTKAKATAEPVSYE